MAPPHPARSSCRSTAGAALLHPPPHQVDATAKENEEAKSKFKIGGFPTIKAGQGQRGKAGRLAQAALAPHAATAPAGLALCNLARSLQPCPLTKSALPTHDCPLRCVPAPQIFRGDLNRPAPYEGPRDEPGIVKYLKKQVGWGGEVGCGGGEAGGMEDGRRAGGSHGDSLQAAAPQLCSV